LSASRADGQGDDFYHTFTRFVHESINVADVVGRQRLGEMGFHTQREGFLLTLAQAPSYILGGGRSFWKLIGFLLLAIGFLIALWLIWVVLRWIIQKLAAFRRK
jgi:hypothetical protein